MNLMKPHLVPAFRMLAVLTFLTGVAYPLLVTATAWILFPAKARGSVIVRGGRPVGSSLIGQPFSDPRYFWGRLSATTPAYNAGASSGSNLGPLNPVLLDQSSARVAALREADPGNLAPVPVDLATGSGSGLDPHISPAAAAFQSARVARARAMEPADVDRLVARFTEARQWGLMGEPRVNVLLLNLALDEAQAPGDGAAPR